LASINHFLNDYFCSRVVNRRGRGGSGYQTDSSVKGDS
jgi:hypothetical protein